MLLRPAVNCAVHDASFQFKKLPQKYHVLSVTRINKNRFKTMNPCYSCKVLNVKTVLRGNIPVPFSQDLYFEMIQAASSEAHNLNVCEAIMDTEVAAGNSGRAEASFAEKVLFENFPEIESEAAAKLNMFELETNPNLKLSESKMVLSFDCQLIFTMTQLAKSSSAAAKRILDMRLKPLEDALIEQGYPLDEQREIALDHVLATDYLKFVPNKGPAVAEMIKCLRTNEKHIGENKRVREFLVEAKEKPPNTVFTDISTSELANRVSANQRNLNLVVLFT